MSVSWPFFTPSWHVAGEHWRLMHTPLSTQSEVLLQSFPMAHFGHFGPPQSTSVSSPSFCASVQDGAAQTPLAHAPLLQSPLAPQPLPSSHCLHSPPPQSTSVSFPAFVPSVQPASLKWTAWSPHPAPE